MRRILVIAVPGLGDALLATPLLAALKRACPGASIDVLVRNGKAILDGNPDVSGILVQRRRPPLLDSVRFLARIFRRYDLAISTSTSDRSFVISLFAAPRRVGKVSDVSPKTWWKRRIVGKFVAVDPDAHVLSENLRLGRILGAEAHCQVQLPRWRHSPGTSYAGLPAELVSGSFAVVHMQPGAVARRWLSEHWRAVIESLRERGMTVFATGGSSTDEAAYVEHVLSGLSSAEDLPTVINLAGKLDLYEVVELLRHAVLFIGIDTSVTHIAAATGIPVVALFGPTDPVRWGPWPAGLVQDGSPWKWDELVQTVGNVTLLRMPCKCGAGQLACSLPLQDACMSQLLPETVLTTVDAILHRMDATRGYTAAASGASFGSADPSPAH